MADALATLVTLVGALILLYVLIKAHVFFIKHTWQPIWEQEHEEEDPEVTQGEPDEESPPRAWDEVR